MQGAKSCTVLHLAGRGCTPKSLLGILLRVRNPEGFVYLFVHVCLCVYDRTIVCPEKLALEYVDTVSKQSSDRNLVADAR